MARQRNHRPETLGGLEKHRVDVFVNEHVGGAPEYGKAIVGCGPVFVANQMFG
ncbi:MAG TPA: hypothetical protein VGA46_07815 [Methyloceanibacter sp.]|jgi:hypothetical protein